MQKFTNLPQFVLRSLSAIIFLYFCYYGVLVASKYSNPTYLPQFLEEMENRAVLPDGTQRVLLASERFNCPSIDFSLIKPDQYLFCSTLDLFDTPNQIISISVTSITYENIRIIIFYSAAIYAMVLFSNLLNRAFGERKSLEIYRSRHRKWADSVYFLGFIYTLVALIFALSKTQPASGLNAVATTIAGNAIALSSTVVALVIRSVWILFLPLARPTENTIEDELRNRARVLLQATLELEKGTRILRDEIGLASSSLSRYAEATDDATKKVSDSNQAMTDEIGSLSGRIRSVEIDNATVRDAFREAFEKVIQGVSTDLSNLSKSISSGANLVNSSLLDLEQALKFNPADVFGVSVDETLKPLSQSLERGAAKVSDGFSQIRERLDGFGAVIDSATVSTSGFSQSTAAATKELETLRDDLTNLKDDLITFRADALKTVEEAAKSGSDRVFSALQPLIVETKSAINGIQSMLSSVNDALRGQTEDNDDLERRRSNRLARALRGSWQELLKALGLNK